MATYYDRNKANHKETGDRLRAEWLSVKTKCPFADRNEWSLFRQDWTAQNKKQITDHLRAQNPTATNKQYDAIKREYKRAQMAQLPATKSVEDFAKMRADTYQRKFDAYHGDDLARLRELPRTKREAMTRALIDRAQKDQYEFTERYGSPSDMK